MQGKVALEEHFALPETVQDSAGFVPNDYWVELKARLLDMQDRRLREMDANGIEMMLLSLNAPAVQAIPDASRRSRSRIGPTISSPAKSPNVRTGFQGLAALPMQDPDAADARADALRARPRLSRRAGQRLQPGRRPAPTPPITTCRNTGRSGPRSNGWTCRSTCIRAIRCRSTPRSMSGHPWLLGPTWAFGAGDRGARAAPDGVRPVRCASEAADRPRPPRRRAALFDLARRQPQRLGEGAPRTIRPSDRSANTSAKISTSPRRATSAPRR